MPAALATLQFQNARLAAYPQNGLVHSFSRTGIGRVTLLQVAHWRDYPSFRFLRGSH